MSSGREMLQLVRQIEVARVIYSQCVGPEGRPPCYLRSARVGQRQSRIAPTTVIEMQGVNAYVIL